MRNTVVTLVAILFGSAIANANLLNSSFENGEGAYPDDWKKSACSQRVGSAQHTGKYSMSLDWSLQTGEASPPSGYFCQNVIKIEEGKKYTLSAWYLDQARSVLDSIYTANIEWYQAGKLLDTTTLKLSSLLVGEKWKQISLSGTAPKGCDTARVVFKGEKMAKGEILYIDDASFVPEPATMCLLGLGGLLLRRKK